MDDQPQLYDLEFTFQSGAELYLTEVLLGQHPDEYIQNMNISLERPSFGGYVLADGERVVVRLDTMLVLRITPHDPASNNPDDPEQHPLFAALDGEEDWDE